MTLSSRPARSVIIVGGGIAGITAAADLHDAGWHVTLIERRPLLGGRATSFEDEQSSQLLDNCQHVLLACCTTLRKLYARLGVASAITYADRIDFKDERGRHASLYANRIPAPFHLATSLARFKLLTWREKFDIARGMLALMLLPEQLPRELFDITFLNWLRAHHQSPSTIARFWDVIITSALNENVSSAAAGYAIQVFKQGFLADRNAWEMGVPNLPLGSLYSTAVADIVITNTRVTALLQRDGQVSGVALADGSILEAEAVILATAPDAAIKLLEGIAGSEQLIATLNQFSFGTIIGAHLFYDRPVMYQPHIAMIGTDLQWLFRKDSEGMHVHGVISAAGTLANENNDALANRFDAEVKRLLPDSASAKLIRSRIIKERRATWAPLPGIEHIRPQQQTTVPGLYLAGDYTATGWPATMEGAARSGQLVAASLNATNAIARP